MSFRFRGYARRVSLVCAGLLLTATAAGAQEPGLAIGELPPLFAPDAATAIVPAEREVAKHATGGRRIFVPLYVSFGALQMLDAHSTLRAVGAGGVEQNPLLRGVANHPAALVAIKAGVAASTIMLAEKVRGRSRVGAIVLMAALNSAYTAIVVHNYRTVR
jgi:hypothetical protein